MHRKNNENENRKRSNIDTANPPKPTQQISTTAAMAKDNPGLRKSLGADYVENAEKKSGSPEAKHTKTKEKPQGQPFGENEYKNLTGKALEDQLKLEKEQLERKKLEDAKARRFIK